MSMRLRRLPPALVILMQLLQLAGTRGFALDPPHDVSQSIDCGSCHITHHAPGGAITNVAGNANLCMSCHSSGGMAASLPFSDGDEAIPGVVGTSHRWDSGVSGWIKADPANTSPGEVSSSGTFSGVRSKSYVITIQSSGDAGVATFGWASSLQVAATYRDELAAIAFDGSNGSIDWSAMPWQETGETDGPAAGLLRVVTAAPCPTGNCLRIGGGAIAGRALSRTGNLGGASSAMVTFSFRRQLSTCPNDSTASVRLQASSDGAAWSDLATYNLNACDTAPVAQAFDVTAFVSAATAIRFVGSGTTGANDFIFADDVQVEFFAADPVQGPVPTGQDVVLDEGIRVSFADGATSPSFSAGDRWTVFVHAEVDQPTAPALAFRLADGKVTCSTCHNEHSQVATPFDPMAPPYPATGPGGEGRHHQRLDNQVNQMCGECHASRVVATASLGSHPVGVGLPGGDYKAPDALPLDSVANQVQCMSCHQLHGGASDDGRLLRLADENALCADCHTLADSAPPAAHLDRAAGALWPGPQYGTDFPEIADVERRGACQNCHQPHGWPDGASPGTDFPMLLVAREENLCYACHDGSPSASNVLLQFTKSYRHPTGDVAGRHEAAEGSDPSSYGLANRHAECSDCHNPHRAASDAGPPVAPIASQRLAGVGRVAVSNGAAGSAPTYQYLGPSDAGPVREYEICFKCHSSWTSQPAGQTDMSVLFNSNNPSFHPVEAQGKNTNIRAQSFVNGWTGTSTMFCSDCHASDDPTVAGPHGSQYRYLLKRPFVASGGPRNTASTEACFDCHRFATYGTTQSSDTVLAYSRFNRPNFEEGHSFHVDEKRAPCYACHDSHGSASEPHLIVTGRNPGLDSYTETATGGSCSPTCHGSESYSLNYPR